MGGRYLIIKHKGIPATLTMTEKGVLRYFNMSTSLWEAYDVTSSDKVNRVQQTQKLVEYVEDRVRKQLNTKARPLRFLAQILSPKAKTSSSVRFWLADGFFLTDKGTSRCTSNDKKITGAGSNFLGPVGRRVSAIQCLSVTGKRHDDS